MKSQIVAWKTVSGSKFLHNTVSLFPVPPIIYRKDRGEYSGIIYLDIQYTFYIWKQIWHISIRIIEGLKYIWH